MFNDSREVTTSGGMRKITGRAMKVLQVMALAVLLVLPGAVASEAAPIAISCVTSTSNDLTQAGVCSPPPAFFDPAGGLQSYSWTFYQSREQLTGDLGLYWQYLNPIYTFQIFGVPDPAFGGLHALRAR